MTAPLLEVRGLEAGYGGEPAIRGVEMRAEAGQLVAVLGPNGGGKTTLFRAIVGEAPARRGAVRVGGPIAYVPQTERPRLDLPLSALDVALMGTYARVPWYRRLSDPERRDAREALRRVGAEGLADEHYGSLSGGQRQRVLIARALAQRADVLLLDEPLTGVDRPNAERIAAILAELRAAGKAVLVATHDIHQARDFDLVLCLNRERTGFGPPAEVLTAEVLERTYGGEIVLLEGGERAIVVGHHAH